MGTCLPAHIQGIWEPQAPPLLLLTSPRPAATQCRTVSLYHRRALPIYSSSSVNPRQKNGANTSKGELLLVLEQQPTCHFCLPLLFPRDLQSAAIPGLEAIWFDINCIFLTLVLSLDIPNLEVHFVNGKRCLRGRTHLGGHRRFSDGLADQQLAFS